MKVEREKKVQLVVIEAEDMKVVWHMQPQLIQTLAWRTCDGVKATAGDAFQGITSSMHRQ